MSDNLRQAFDRDGYIVVRDLLTPAECAAYKREADVVRGTTWHASGGDEATVFVGLAAASQVFRDLAAAPRLVAALAPLMDDGVAFLSDKLVLKSARKGFPTPWHIDRYYWNGTRPKLSVWLALDDVGDDDGALCVVRGSHRLDIPSRPGDVSRSNNEFDVVSQAGRWRAEDELGCPIPRGAAIIFSDRLVHGSRPSTSGRDRWAWIGTYHAPGADEPFDRNFPARRTLVASTSVRCP